MTARRTTEATMEDARTIAPRGFWMRSIINRRDRRPRCYCCGALAAGRSLMNIWGTVCDFPTCDRCHAEVDGKWADSIPCPSS